MKYTHNYITKFLQDGKQINIRPENLIIKFLPDEEQIEINPDNLIEKFLQNEEKIEIYPDNYITKFLQNKEKIIITDNEIKKITKHKNMLGISIDNLFDDSNSYIQQI